MTTVNIHAAKTNLSRLLEEVAAGEEIIIAKAGKPLARLVPMNALKTERRVLGLLEGEGAIPLWFDDPLPDDLLDAFEGL
jgi:prevent-host-death family protein